MFAPTDVAFRLLGPGITASLTLASVRSTDSVTFVLCFD